MNGTDLHTGGWILVSIYMIAALALSIRGSKKIKNMKDYSVGTLAFSPWAVGLSLAASTTSAATFVINPGFTAYYGLSAMISFGVALPIALIASLVVFTKEFRNHGQTVQAATMAQWVGKRYGSNGYQWFFAILSLLLITFIVLICVGLTVVVAKLLGLEALPALIGIVVFIFGYMMIGGANSMVYTNAIQAAGMLVVALILFGSGAEHFSDGVGGFLDKLGAAGAELVQATNPKSPLMRDYFEIIFCQVVIGIAIICQPHIITKSLLLKKDKDVNRYLWTGSIVQMLFFWVVIAGLFARITFPDLTLNGEAIKLDRVMTEYVAAKFSTYVAIFVFVGLMAAGISTLEGLIQSISASITQDIVEPAVEKFGLFKNRDMEKVHLAINKVVIAVIGVVTILVSYRQIVEPNLSVAILAQNGVYGYFTAAFAPVFFGIFFKNFPPKAVIVSSVLAVTLHFYIYYVGYFPGITGYMRDGSGELLPVRNPAIPSAVALVVSTLTGLILRKVFTSTGSATAGGHSSRPSQGRAAAETNNGHSPSRPAKVR